jgi:hypothetical protein
VAQAAGKLWGDLERIPPRIATRARATISCQSVVCGVWLCGCVLTEFSSRQRAASGNEASSWQCSCGVWNSGRGNDPRILCIMLWHMRHGCPRRAKAESRDSLRQTFHYDRPACSAIVTCWSYLQSRQECNSTMILSSTLTGQVTLWLLLDIVTLTYSRM